MMLLVLIVLTAIVALAICHSEARKFDRETEATLSAIVNSSPEKWEE